VFSADLALSPDTSAGFPLSINDIAMRGDKAFITYGPTNKPGRVVEVSLTNGTFNDIFKVNQTQWGDVHGITVCPDGTAFVSTERSLQVR
jgi:hypothetical protein